MKLPELASTEEIEICLLLEAIYRKYKYDFRGYSRSAMARRLIDAQHRFGCRSLSALQEKLLREPALLPDLLDTMTIQVSEMFRDPQYFRTVRESVIPHLRTYPSIKVWIAGCGEGEEFYSLAILFREEGLESRTIFYATDVNPAALAKAESGIYRLNRIQRFTENHQAAGAKTSLSDYYTAAYGAAVFDRSLRARVVFAPHNLVSDETFAEVHLVSCRNVLIYFGRELQNRVVGVFENSLIHGGLLGLGSQETLRFIHHSDHFSEFSRGDRIYRKIASRADHVEFSHGLA